MSLTRMAQRFIADHPSIKDCVRRGLINYSALSRLICEEHGIKKFDAVLVASRRYADRIQQHASAEKKILSLLKKAKLRTRNKMAVVILEKPKEYERLLNLQRSIKAEGGEFNLIEGDGAVVLILEDDYTSLIRDHFKGKVKKLTESLVQVSMTFDERIETTPGVVSYVYGLLAENNINVLEEMSCWTELMIMLSEEDAGKALRILRF